MDIVKIIGIGLIALIIIVIIKQYRPEFVIYVSLIAGALILLMIMDKIGVIIELLTTLSNKTAINNEFLVLLIKITGIVESVLKITVVLAIPSKILGLIVGVIQSVVVLYVFLFLVSLPILKVPYVNDSKYAKIILEKTPFISRITDGVVKTFDEISKFSDENLNKNYDSKKANKEMLEIMLKNKVITVENARILSDKSKIEVDNINELLERYKEE